jgi:hypothetical protein
VDEQTEQHLWFELIGNLWREREKKEFVSRQELHDAMYKRIPAVESEGEVLTELAHGGVDLTLDAFAFYGYNEKAFSGRLNGDVDQLPAKSGLFWRYKVTRLQIVGYVRPEHLSDVEREQSERSARRLK